MHSVLAYHTAIPLNKVYARPTRPGLSTAAQIEQNDVSRSALAAVPLHQGWVRPQGRGYRTRVLVVAPLSIFSSHNATKCLLPSPRGDLGAASGKLTKHQRHWINARLNGWFEPGHGPGTGREFVSFQTHLLQ